MSGAADVYRPGYIGACTFAGIRSPLRDWGVGHGRLTIGARAHFNSQGSNRFAMRWMRCHIQRSPPWWGKSHVMREKISWPQASTPESELGYSRWFGEKRVMLRLLRKRDSSYNHAIWEIVDFEVNRFFKSVS